VRNDVDVQIGERVSAAVHSHDEMDTGGDGAVTNCDRSDDDLARLPGSVEICNRPDTRSSSKCMVQF
jgi:hypothetical protein